MKQPVLCTLDGKSYEESAIRKWLLKHNSSPWNRKKMKSNQTIDDVLIRNISLEEKIEVFIQKNPDYIDQVQKSSL